MHVYGITQKSINFFVNLFSKFNTNEDSITRFDQPKRKRGNRNRNRGGNRGGKGRSQGKGQGTPKNTKKD